MILKLILVIAVCLVILLIKGILSSRRPACFVSENKKDGCDGDGCPVKMSCALYKNYVSNK